MKNTRRLLALTLCIALACSTVTASATQASSGGTSLTPPDGISQSLSPANISINVKDADVRDVLSAVAVNMGYSIIYKGDVSSISVKIENLPPAAAFDYLLKILNMASLQDGSTLIVGTKETLTQDFKRSLSLTSFNLKYIKADVIAQQLGTLGIPVTVLSLNANPYTLWVQGFPTDISKVGQLVNIMDIYENEDVSADIAGNAGAKNIYRVELRYLSATQFNAFLKTLGIDCGLPLSDDRETLWFYATSAERDTIMNIRSKVDRSYVNIDEVSGNGTTFKVLSTQSVSKDTILSAIGAVVPKLQLVTVGNRTTAILAVGLKEDIERAERLIADLEGSLKGTNALYTTFYKHDLKKITAVEAEKRLANVKFGDTVGFYTTPYPEFANTIFAYCSQDYRNVVIDLLNQIDSAANKIRIPVFQSADKAVLDSVQLVVTTLLEHQLGTNGGAVFDRVGTFLYVDCPPETARLIEDMVAKMSSTPQSEAKAADLSTAAYVKYFAEKGITRADPSVSQTPEDWRLYGLWVNDQLAKGGKSGRMAGVNDLTATPGMPVISAGEQLLADADAALVAQFASYAISVTDNATADTAMSQILAAARKFLSTDYKTVSIDQKAATYLYTLPTAEAEGSYTLNLELSAADEAALSKICKLVFTLPKAGTTPPAPTAPVAPPTPVTPAPPTAPPVKADLLTQAAAALDSHMASYRATTIVDEATAAVAAKEQVLLDINRFFSGSQDYKAVKAAYVKHSYTAPTDGVLGSLSIDLTLTQGTAVKDCTCTISLPRGEAPKPETKPEVKPETTPVVTTP